MVEIDEIDRQLIHALSLDGRAPFSRIAEVLGLSDQTVARRYRRLRASGTANVVAQVTPWLVGHVRSYLRIRCQPATALPLATALARRPDTYWVRLFSGGTEIGCVAQSYDPEETDSLLLQQLPKTPRVIDVTAHSLLHVFFGGPYEHPDLVNALTPAQVEALRPAVRPAETVIPLEPEDFRMLAVLEKDGRAGFAELAKATGWSESTVRRRVEYLRDCGALFFDVDADIEALGHRSEAMMWMAVPPAELASIGEALGDHSEVAFVAATTGNANLIASVVCRDASAFYRYLTTKVAALKAIHHIETSPVIRTVKRGATLVQSN